MKKFSSAVKTISENVVAAIAKYEETGQWAYTRCYAGKDVLYNETVTGSYSVLGWLADKVSQAADFIRDIDKRW